MARPRARRRWRHRLHVDHGRGTGPAPSYRGRSAAPGTLTTRHHSGPAAGNDRGAGSESNDTTRYLTTGATERMTAGSFGRCLRLHLRAEGPHGGAGAARLEDHEDQSLGVRAETISKATPATGMRYALATTALIDGFLRP